MIILARCLVSRGREPGCAFLGSDGKTFHRVAGELELGAPVFRKGAALHCTAYHAAAALVKALEHRLASYPVEVVFMEAGGVDHG